MAQVERLMQELDLIKSGRNPVEAAREIRDYVDLHASEDQLAKLSEFMNPWIPDKEQKGKKKNKKDH